MDIPRRASMARLISPTSSLARTQGSNHFMLPHRKHQGSNTPPDMSESVPISGSFASRMTPRVGSFANHRAESIALESDDEASTSASSSHLPPAQVSSSFGSVLDDATILKNVGKHLATDSEHSLQLQGGDITRDLYNLSNKGQQIKRTRSLSGSDVLGERRGSSASVLRVPGAFRREFINQKRTKFGYTLNKPTGLTRNFLEFLSVYGHFAGEDLEDEDFLACDYASDYKHDEENPLLEEASVNSYTIPTQRHQFQPKLRKKGKASTMKSFFLLFKSFVGTGVLFLPKAFSNGGLLLSTGLLLFFATLSFFCYLILVQAKEKTGVSSFGDIGGILYGKYAKFFILASIVLSQLGFVATYIVFTAENLHAFFENAFSLHVAVGLIVVLESIFFIPMSLVRNITKLSLAALLANVFILIGIFTIVYYTAADLIKHGPAPDISIFSNDKWSLFIGVAIFAFEGIGLIIPVEEAMAKPQDFPKVLFAVVAACAVLFIGIGAIGYLTYGNDVKTVIILSLPQNSPYVIMIQLFYPVAIMFSVPLQLLPAVRIMEKKIFKKRSGKSNSVVKWEKNTFRIFFVMLTTLIAFYGSTNLDQFVSFVGCFACIPLVYMYPPMLHYRACAKSNFSKGLDLSITLLGSIALCYTIYQIIKG